MGGCQKGKLAVEPIDYKCKTKKEQPTRCKCNNIFTVANLFVNKKLSCRRETARVIEYFAMSLKVTQGHSK